MSNPVRHAFIEIVDEIDGTKFFAYRTLQGNEAPMARVLTLAAIDDPPPIRLSGGALLLRLGRMKTYPQLEAIDPKTFPVSRKALHYLITLRKGKPPHLDLFQHVNNPSHLIYQGTIGAFCFDYDAITREEYSAKLIQRQQRNERQRLRRNQRKKEEARINAETAKHSAKLRHKYEEPPEMPQSTKPVRQISPSELKKMWKE